MKNLIMIILVFSIIGCSPLTKLQKTENKVAKGLEKLKRKYPEAYKNTIMETVRIDTILQEIEIQGEAEITVDSIAIDSLILLLKQALLKDVDSGETTSDVLYQIIAENTAELINIDSVGIDTLGIQLNIWYNKGKSILEFSIHKDSIHIEVEKDIETINITNTEVIKKRFYQDWLFWLIAFLIFIAFVFKGAIKTWVKLQTGRFRR